MEQSLYIELLKYTLTDYHRMEFGEVKPLASNKKRSSWQFKIANLLDTVLSKLGLKLVKVVKTDQKSRYEGKDWPACADSMVGLERLNNIEYCFREVIKNDIPGDFIETGVWRGGSTILMKALLKEHNIEDRTVWVADSFEGLPKPNATKYSADKGDTFHKHEELSISLETVKHNFEKYNLLDDKVQFLKGWFKDTLPMAPINQLAILRLDGDMYESTMDGLKNLYPKLSIGGYIIIDDWGDVPACTKAVADYRKQHNINEEIIQIGWTGAYWKKEN